jgi:hypothetical protein
MTLAKSLLQAPALLAAPLVIQLLFDAANEVLLVPFPERLTRINFDRADDALAMFVARRGPADTIIDFSDVCEDVDTSVVLARAYVPWPAQQKRRVFIVSSDVMEDLFRMYAIHHEAAGFDPPRIVRSVEGALAALEATKAKFDPVTYN